MLARSPQATDSSRGVTGVGWPCRAASEGRQEPKAVGWDRPPRPHAEPLPGPG